MNVQIIKQNGKPEWAVLPYEAYLKMVEQVELLQDIQDYDQITTALENGEDEIVPSELVYALLDGENPIKVWREYRRLTQQQVAGSIGISVPYLSQLERGKRNPSTVVLSALARKLQVTVDDLLTAPSE